MEQVLSAPPRPLAPLLPQLWDPSLNFQLLSCCVIMGSSLHVSGPLGAWEDPGCSSEDKEPASSLQGTQGPLDTTGFELQWFRTGPIQSSQCLAMKWDNHTFSSPGLHFTEGKTEVSPSPRGK